MTVTSTEWIELDGIGSQSLRYRFDLLNPDLTKAGELPVRSDVAPRLRNNAGARIKRRLDLTPEPGVLDEINVLTARVRPVCLTPDGTEHPMGTLMFADAISVDAIPDNEHSAVLLDQGLILDQQSDRTYGVSPGTIYEDVILSILSEHGILDVSIETASDHTADEPISWRVGTSWLRIINDLARLTGAFDLFFDNRGVARLVEAPPLDTETVSYNNFTPRLFLGGTTAERFPLDAPNRYVVVEGGAAEFPVTGVYDVPASAPHSAANRGFVVTRTEVLQGICQPAGHCALAFAKSNTADYESASFISGVDPRHDTYDVVNLNHQLYREQSWSAELSGTGDMRHNLRRSYDA